MNLTSDKSEIYFLTTDLRVIMASCWATWKICFLTTTHGHLLLPSNKAFFPRDTDLSYLFLSILCENYVDIHSCFDKTALLVAGIHLTVSYSSENLRKFNLLKRLKHGQGTTISILFFDFHVIVSYRFPQTNKENIYNFHFKHTWTFCNCSIFGSLGLLGVKSDWNVPFWKPICIIVVLGSLCALRLSSCDLYFLPPIVLWFLYWFFFSSLKSFFVHYNWMLQLPRLL